MPRTRLNDKTVRGLKSEAGQPFTEVWDTILAGFGIRVYPSGRRSWYVRYRSNGRQRRASLGHYPKIGVAQARELARDRMATASVETSQGDAMTVADLVALFRELHAPKKRPKSRQEDERIFSKDILPALGTAQLREVDVSAVTEVIDRVARRGSPIMANRTRALMSKLWNFGMARGLVTSNPIAATERPGVERARDRVLSNDELRVLWEVWETEGTVMASLFQMLLLTAQRGAEVKAMRWDEIDDNAWTIPGERAKNGRPHCILLPPLAVDLLERSRATKSPFVFPGKAGHLKELGVAVRRYRRRSKIFDWSPHDLRRTVTSRLAEMGTPPHVLAALLNHAPAGITNRVYNRYQYRDEIGEALRIWGEHVTALTSTSQND